MDEEFREKIEKDHLFLPKEILGHDLWEKETEIINSVFSHPKTAVRSCHASGKSFTSASTAIDFIFTFVPSIVITTAPTWRQVEDILWREIRKQHKNAKVKLKDGRILTLGGDMFLTRYNLSEDWYAVGLSTDDPDKFSGYHAPYILIIVDEAPGVPSAIFEAMDGILSTGYTRLLEIGNPTDPTGHFANNFKSEFYHKIHITCFDTPNFKPFPNIETLLQSTPEQRAEAVIRPYLITPQWVFEKYYDWGPESPMFQARCLGEFPQEGEDILIPLRLIEQAQRRWEEADKGGRIEKGGLDIARFGTDKTVFALRAGNVIVRIDKHSKEDTVKTTGRAAQMLTDNPAMTLNIDEIGVGGGPLDTLRNNDKIGDRAIGINVGLPATSDDLKEQFINLRAQLSWALRERFYSGDIAIPPDEELAAQLSSIKYSYTSKGQRKIESKEDMKKRGLKSPDCADAIMLAFADIVTPAQTVADYYKGIMSQEGQPGITEWVNKARRIE